MLKTHKRNIFSVVTRKRNGSSIWKIYVCLVVSPYNAILHKIYVCATAACVQADSSWISSHAALNFGLLEKWWWEMMMICYPDVIIINRRKTVRHKTYTLNTSCGNCDETTKNIRARWKLSNGKLKRKKNNLNDAGRWIFSPHASYDHHHDTSHTEWSENFLLHRKKSFFILVLGIFRVCAVKYLGLMTVSWVVYCYR